MTQFTILTIKQQILIQELQFIHSVNGDGSKTAKIIQKVILLSITLTFRQCDGNITFLMIFAVFVVLFSVSTTRLGCMILVVSVYMCV